MTQSKLPSFLLTTWLLLGTIATKSRMGEFLHSLQEYEIVYPRVISNENGRGRRSTRESLEPMLLEISNWTLRTVVNDRFLFSSNFTVDWVKRGKGGWRITKRQDAIYDGEVWKATRVLSLWSLSVRRTYMQ